MKMKKIALAALALAALSAHANGYVDCTPGNVDSTCVTAAPALPQSFCKNSGRWFLDASEAMSAGLVYRDETGLCHTADSPVALAAMGGGGSGGGSANRGPNNSWSAPGMTGGFSEGFNSMGQSDAGNPGSAGPGTSTTGGDGGTGGGGGDGGTGGTGGGGGD